MTKAHHPHTRAERKRLAAAKSLANPLFHQRRINAKKRIKLIAIQDQESKNELSETGVEVINTD